LALRYEQELPSHKIAERIESTAEAVRIALFRIRIALKACIGKTLAAEAAS
jgi:DNA-directed RNA polymerase specialized sigma24 family protein